MNTKIVSIAIAALVIGGGVGFFGGMSYQAGKASSVAAGKTGAPGAYMGGSGQRGMRGGVAGQIISNDGTTLSLQLPVGGSKIVLISSSTAVTKSVPGMSSDLSAGQQVIVSGAANPDGSVTAQSIQIRPATTTSAR
jgi:hypothetical protein